MTKPRKPAKGFQDRQKSAMLRAVTRAKRALIKEHALHSGKLGKGGWRAAGARFGITGALAFRIAKQGYVPKDGEICKRLGIPVFAPAVVCPKHGIVHHGRCPRKTFEENAAEYDEWKIEHAAELTARVASLTG